ncbi:MAG: discoidin domain-containing protein [Bacteroidales bacterium]|nr:discoidin domain-containing protein [Bacteroidales bacterium]
MKKAILSAIMGLATLGAAATDYVVYGTVGEGQEQIPCNYYQWEGTYDSQEVDGATVWTIHNDTWFGGGWESVETWDASVLNNTDVKLKFEYKTTGNSIVSLQFNNTSKGVTDQLEVSLPDRDGEWHEAVVDMNAKYQKVLSSITNGDKVYVFAPVGGAGWGGKEISFRNIRFEVTGEQVEPEPEPDFGLGNVWHGSAQGKSAQSGKFSLNIDYEITANADGTFTIVAEFDNTDASFNYELLNRGKWDKFENVGGNTFSLTTTNTYALKERVYELAFWIASSDGLIRIDFEYLFGAGNELVIAPRVSAKAENVTATSADIVYDVTLPAELEGADVVVYLNDEVAAASPVALTGLTPNTAYAYTLKAVATLGGETYEGKPLKVEFKTLRDGATTLVYYAIADDLVPNAYLDGEDPATDRRDIPMSIEAKIIYNPDMTMTVEAIPHCNGNIVGLVPGITLRGKFDRKDMVVEDGKWTVTTPAGVTYDEGEGFDYLYFWLRYDGGESGNRFFIHGYKAGDVNEPVAYGEAASIDLTIGATEFAVDQTALVTTVVKDGNGHYLLDQTADLSVEGSAFVIDNGKLVATGLGTATVTATMGEISKSTDVICFLTSAAENKALNLETANVESDHENPAPAFDGNEDSQMVWDCSQTDEHYLRLDLGAVMHVQAVQLVWEGASATNYTVTLENEAAEPAMMRAAVKEDGHVFTVEDGDGGAGKTPRKNLYLEDYTPIAARYVTLNTTKAFDSGWGIKLKEMRVMGTVAPTVGVEDVAVDTDTVVNVYTLQGVCVLRGVNPAEAADCLPAGVYIMGTRKVVVK